MLVYFVLLNFSKKKKNKIVLVDITICGRESFVLLCSRSLVF